MHPAIETMLKKYNCHSQQDYINASKEERRGQMKPLNFKLSKKPC
jgi:hypothetical protein